MGNGNNKKPNKLTKIEKIIDSGEYKLVVVTTRLSPINYKTMRSCMEEMGIDNESVYVQMSIALMNQSKSGIK